MSDDRDRREVEWPEPAPDPDEERSHPEARIADKLDEQAEEPEEEERGRRWWR